MMQSDDALPSDGMLTEGEKPAYPRTRHGVFVLAVIIAAVLLSYVDRHMLGLMIAPVKADLGISDFQMSLLVGFAFSLFYAVFGVPSGRLVDAMNRKWLISLGICMWSLATISSGLAESFAMLLLCRIAVGVGESVLGPASYSLLGDLFPPKHLVRATSVLSLAILLSSGLALVIGGQAYHLAGTLHSWPFGMGELEPWQRAFIMVGGLGFVLLLLVVAVREPVRQEGAHAGERLAYGVFAYLWSERGLYAPILLTGGGMACMLANGLNWFPTHMIRVFGETPAQAGLILGTIQIFGSILGTVLGLLLTEFFMRRGYTDAPLRSVMITSMGLAVLTVVFFVQSREIAIALWALAVVFQNTYYGNIVAALQLVTPNRARGTAIALLYLMINIFAVGFGSAIIGWISTQLFINDPRGIGYGLAVVGGGGALLAVISSSIGLRRYRHARASFN